MEYDKKFRIPYEGIIFHRLLSLQVCFELAYFWDNILSILLHANLAITIY